MFFDRLNVIDDLGTEDLKTMIIYSAMRFGLLLNKDYLEKFTNILCDVPYSYNGKIWYEIDIPETNNTQIWNPDSMTLVLLDHWYKRVLIKNKGDDICFDIYRNIKRLLQPSGYSFNRNKINSINKIIDGISVAAAYKIPSHINDSSTGVIDNRTVNKTCYLRLLSGMSPKLRDVNKIESNRSVNLIEPSKASLKHFEHDDNFINIIRNCLNGDDESAISERILGLIKNNESKITPSMVYVGKWICTRLIKRNDFGNKLSINTIKKSFNYIAKDMVGVFDGKNPVDLNPDDLRSLYLEMIDNWGESKGFIKALKDFNCYLQMYEGGAKIDSGLPWFKHTKYIPVDANIVTWKETEAIESYFWKKIRNTQNSEYERQLMSLRLIVYALGFYTGMRRREIIGAKLGDITVIGRQIYTVRPYDGHTMKTSNAIRQLPIWLLLPKDILKLVNTYIDFRINNGGNNDDYLFDLSGNTESTQISERLVFCHIHWVVQVISGNDKARFHHLRHSCGSWMLWKLSLPYLDSKESGFSGMPEFTNEELSRLQENMLAHSSLRFPSSNMLAEIARMLGHSNGGMSLSHYVHSVHWIINDYRERLVPSLPSRVLSKLAGITIRQVQKLADNDPHANLTTALIGKTVIRSLSKISKSPDVSNWVEPAKKELGDFKRELGGIRLVEFDIWKASKEYFEEGKNRSKLIEEYNIEGDALDRAIENVKAVFSSEKDKPIILCRLPNAIKELKTAELMITNYKGLSISKRAPVNCAVNYHMNNHTNTGVYFNKKEELSKYLKIFDALKLWKTDGNKQIHAYRLTLNSDKPLGSLDRQKQWDFWTRSNSFQNYQMSNQVDESIKSARGQIYIDYITEKPKKESSQTKRLADRGFILGINILAVMYSGSSNI